MTSFLNCSLIAHRGAAKYAPENTLIACRKAKELGALWVEFDVMLTADGHAIIMHDETVDRTTTGQGKVKHLTLEQIKQLDAGCWFAPEFAGERVPTLDEWLALCAELGLGINIELKEKSAYAHRVAQRVHEALQKYWRDDLPPPLISSANSACLRAMYAMGIHYRLGFISDRWPWMLVRRLRHLHCQSLHVNYQRVSARRVMKLKKAGFHLLTWTVNDSAVAQNLLKNGIDAIFSDDPYLGGEVNATS